MGTEEEQVGHKLMIAFVTVAMWEVVHKQVAAVAAVVVTEAMLGVVHKQPQVLVAVVAVLILIAVQVVHKQMFALCFVVEHRSAAVVGEEHKEVQKNHY